MQCTPLQWNVIDLTAKGRDPKWYPSLTYSDTVTNDGVKQREKRAKLE
jgi:hypothetical protein